MSYDSRMDIAPVTVRGPIPRGSVRFARLFTHENRLYIAEGTNRGKTVLRVSSYPIPEGEPQRLGNQMTWGSFKWSSCGCGNRWGDHSMEELIALAEPVPA